MGRTTGSLTWKVPHSATPHIRLRPRNYPMSLATSRARSHYPSMRRQFANWLDVLQTARVSKIRNNQFVNTGEHKILNTCTPYVLFLTLCRLYFPKSRIICLLFNCRLLVHRRFRCSGTEIYLNHLSADPFESSAAFPLSYRFSLVPC